MRIKAVSEYIKVRTRHDDELPCVAIERDGTCRLTIRYSAGISQSQMDKREIYFYFSQYRTFGYNDGPILPQRSFRSFVNQHKELIKKLINGWGLPRLNFQGNYVCDLTDEAEDALRQLDESAGLFGDCLV